MEEARSEVERIFEVSDQRKHSLQSSLYVDQESLKSTTPAFLHLLAESSFSYRAASRLGPKKFQQLDKIHIDKIGREEVGKFKWKKMSEKEQYEPIYDILSDPEEYDE